MVEPSDLESYRVIESGDKYEVRAASGRTIMVCADESSASHYADLLHRAFAAGYKKGYRDGRSGD